MGRFLSDPRFGEGDGSFVRSVSSKTSPTGAACPAWGD
jgi:hypothetical protein